MATLKEINKEMIDFYHYIEEKLEIKPKTVRSPAKHAIKSLSLSKAVHPYDPAMAGFRLLLAEEEAATAIFQSMKRRNYDKASYLDKHNHRHKVCVNPFIGIISSVLSKVFPYMHCNYFYNKEDAKEPLNAIITITAPDQSILRKIKPDMPFNLDVAVEGETHHFEQDIENAIKEYGYKSVTKYIQQGAKIRNTVLYATEQGIPGGFKNYDLLYEKKKHAVYTLLAVCLLVDDYNVIQPFAQQCLYAFLKMQNDKSVIDV